MFFTSFTLYVIPSLRWNWPHSWNCKSWRLIRRWQSAWRWQRALQMLNNRVGWHGLLALARTHIESHSKPSLQPSSTIQWKSQTPEKTLRSFILLWWEQLSLSPYRTHLVSSAPQEWKDSPVIWVKIGDAARASFPCICCLAQLLAIFDMALSQLPLSSQLPHTLTHHNTHSHTHACMLSHFRHVQLCKPVDGSPPGSSACGIL